MSFRPACQRAAQRQSFKPSEFIWISEEALNNVFQRFYDVSKTSRRYGSFVPGPLEASRRLGKRRMAHMAEMPSTAAGGLGFWLGSSWWSSLWEKDLTKWQWEPPRTKSADLAEPAPDLPPWLIGWDSAPDTEEAATMPGETTKAMEIKCQEAIEMPRELTNAAETTTNNRTMRPADIDDFVASLELMPDNVSQACDVFTQRLKRSLILGLRSKEAFTTILMNVLKKVPDAIRQANIDIIEAQTLCLHLYQSIWDGLEASEFISPRLMGRGLASLLLKAVLDVPISDGVWSLVARIITGSSSSQRKNMTSALPRVTLTWLQYNMDRLPGARLSQATEALRVSGQHLDSLQDILQSEQTEQKKKFLAVRQARNGMRLALREIELLESPADHWLPGMPSIIHILQELSVHKVKVSMKSCMDLISQSSFADDEKLNRSIQRTLKNNLLLLVARMPSLDDDFLISMLKQTNERATIRLLSSLTIEHWLSQKKIAGKSELRLQLRYEGIEADLGIRQQDLGTIVVATYKNTQWCWEKQAFIWKLCDELGRPWVAFHTLIRMRQAHLRIPMPLIRNLVSRTSKHDARLALQIHSWYYFNTKKNLENRLPTEYIKGFVIPMINEKRVKPEDIWRVLRISMYGGVYVDGTWHFGQCPVMKEVELLYDVADAFAKCPTRPPRIAFKNTMRCLYYVRKWKAPITPKLCRAVVYAGATRYLEAGLWIPRERLRWLMGLIEFVEGEEVARKIVDAVEYWNSSIHARYDWERRDRDPLKLDQGF